MNPFSILILTFFLLTTSALAHINVEKTLYSPSKKGPSPPGTVSFENGLYVDLAEVTNFNWLEYVYWVKKEYGDTSQTYRAALPDTLVWGERNPYAQFYFTHIAYRNFPVVGISYSQAIDFCAWRSDRVNEYLFAKKNKNGYEAYKKDPSSIQIPTICTFRLPTEQEWEKFAAAPFSKKSIRKQKGSFAYNVKREKAPTDPNTDITAPVDSFWPNTYGVHHLIGNVSEMISAKGISKGGSWKNSKKEATITAQFTYSTPTNWLGFRCVCEVVAG